MSSDAGDGHRQSLFLALFILSFCTYAAFFNGGGWNQNAHFALTRAIVERGTITIDARLMARADSKPNRRSAETK